MNYNVYENPLLTRYSSKEMSENFSEKKRITLFRKLWVALAEGERELGLNITKEQIEELKKYQENINFEDAREHEKNLRHDVMAHIYAYGMQCPHAKGIIHLGATSCYVTDNADILIYMDALKIIEAKLASVINSLSKFSLKYKDMPTLGFTHLQPAQLVTVGKRASLWLQDLAFDLEDLIYLKNKKIKLRGVKGTTGTQASFMQLFDNDYKKVKKLNELVAKKMGLNSCFELSGQTYSRKLDYSILTILSSISQSASKFANDIRLLQSMKEIEEPFEKNQVGSSAMAYKRNPMRSERVCSLARFVQSLPINAAFTSSTQWMERTLDDSANRRIVMAQAFMGVDSILNLYLNITSNLIVYPKIIEKHINNELPFMATEAILMECVKAGGDRQILHRKIEDLSIIASKNVKEKGGENNLIELIKNDNDFIAMRDKIDDIMHPSNFIGASALQVVDYVNNIIKPILANYKNDLSEDFELNV